MMHNPRKDGVAIAVKMPKHTMEFVKNNPKIAQIVAPLLAQFKMAAESHKRAVDLFLDGKGFEPLLENGHTLEDLREFLKAAYDAFTKPENIIAMSEANEEEFDKFQQELRDKVGDDRVVTTKVGFDKKEDDGVSIKGLKVDKDGNIINPDGSTNSTLN